MKTSVLISICLILSSFSYLNAQTGNPKMVKIQGQVSDGYGEPLRKGYVFVDSLKTGVRTNKRGEFKLRIPPKTNIISIFSPENGIQSVVYNGEGKIDFIFPKNNEVISEQELSELGYVFDVEVFRNVGKKSYSEYTDIYQIIREKFSGVRVDGTSIYVRGVISLDGNQTPLFVVDGNYVNSISSINPDELKSIELLKGEETALYGSRGAAGVFLISLK